MDLKTVTVIDSASTLKKPRRTFTAEFKHQLIQQCQQREAGEIFNQTKPKLAVYSHIVNGVSSKIIGIPDEVLIQRTRVNYQGPLVVGRDLMSFLLTPTKIDTYTP